MPVLHEDRATVGKIHAMKVEKYGVAQAAAAIHVQLGAVLDAIAAAGRRTNTVRADAFDAVVVDQAVVADLTDVAGTAAVHIGLGLVDHPVRTGRCLADIVGADLGLAVARLDAIAPGRTAGAIRPAAVDVGLEAVLEAVVAGRGLADAIGA